MAYSLFFSTHKSIKGVLTIYSKLGIILSLSPVTHYHYLYSCYFSYDDDDDGYDDDGSFSNSPTTCDYKDDMSIWLCSKKTMTEQ